MKRKISNIFKYSLFSVIAVLFGVLTVYNCKLYEEKNITYEELKKDELTFQSYEYIKVTKNNIIVSIYFEEFEQPFYLSSVTKEVIDKDALQSLSYGDVLDVYYKDSGHRDYLYDVCEMTNDNYEVLTLANYVSVNKDNQLVGIVFCAILSVLSLGTMIYLIILDNVYSNTKKVASKMKKKYKLSDEEEKVLLDHLNYAKKEVKLNRPKEEIYQKFKETFFEKNNRTYTSAIDLDEYTVYDEIFDKVLADMALEKQIKVVYEEDEGYEDSIYLIYKINDHVAVINLFKNEHTNLFHVNEDTLVFKSDELVIPSKEEINCFLEDVRRYNLYNENIFSIK